MPARSTRAPLPREHGAWVMLYAPLVTGLAVYDVDAVDAVLLVILATAAFFAQNAVGLLLRERGGESTRRWLLGCTLLVALGAAALWWRGDGAVLMLAVPVGVLASWQALRRRQTRRQIDHSTLNEMLTVPVLGLGAPAAQIVAAGAVTAHALLPAFLFGGYFLGSVLFVKMLVAAARTGSRDERGPLRWEHGGACLAYHAALAWGLGAAAITTPGSRWLLLPVLAGLLPVLGRTLWMWWTLSPGPPPLRRVGFIEVAVATWFSAWAGLGLAAGSLGVR